MNHQRSKECFHKIVSFQVHEDCSQSAAICQKRCQEMHVTNISSCTIPLDIIQEHFSQIKTRLIQVLKVFNVKFTKEYEQVIKVFQKKYTQSLKQMERHMLSSLIKATNMNKDVLDKIENERFERLKCKEVFEFLEVKTDFQVRVKSAALQEIYESHLNNLKIYHKNYDWKIKTPQGFNPPNVSKNFIDLQGQTTNALVLKYQNLIKSLNEKNEELKKMLQKSTQRNRQNLKLKTWDILRVKTKKIAKEPKEKPQQKVHESTTVDQSQKAPQPNVSNVEVPQKKPTLNEFDNFDSEEISDFIEKKKIQQ